MATVTDAHRLVATGLNAEVERFSDGDALSERIREWLETPEGTLADLPHWGHNLLGFKHDPQSVNLQVALESSIARKLVQDVADLVLTGISVEFAEIDYFRIIIRHQFGGTAGTLSL